MKVLRITTEINRSSIGRTTEQIGRMVINEGWESYIAWGRTDGTSDSHKIHIGNRSSVLFHVLLTRLFDMHGYGSYFATKKFLKTIDDIKPDIIHLHDIHGYYINIKLLFNYLKKNNVPVVWTHHDNWAFTGHCGSIKDKCEKWKTGCHNCPIYNMYPKSWFYDGCSRNYKYKKKYFTSLKQIYNVGVSEWTCAELRDSFLNKFYIEKIYNGIDTSVFKPNKTFEKEIREKYHLGNGFLLTAVSTAWSASKGLNDYLALRKKLDEKYTIVFVGATQDLIDSLPHGIIGIKRTDNMEELASIYSISSIVMNLSESESFGKTTPEGLACGVPSIVYNCTASPELVDEKTGIVVEKGDINGVAQAVDKIMSWDKESTAKKCRERAVNLFNVNNNWAKYIELYKKIAEERHFI